MVDDESMSDDGDPVASLCLKFVSATFGNVPNCIEVFKDLDGSLIDESSVNTIETAHRRLCPDAQLGAGRTSRRDTPQKLRQVYDAAFSRLYEGLGLSTVEERGSLIETVKRIKRGMPYDVSRDDQILLRDYLGHLLPFCILCQDWVLREVANYGCACSTFVCSRCYVNDRAQLDASTCPTCFCPPPQAFVGRMPYQVPVETPESPVREPATSRPRTGDAPVAAQEQGPLVTPEVIASHQEVQALREQNYQLRMAGQSLEQAHAQLQATVLQGAGPSAQHLSPSWSSLQQEVSYSDQVLMMQGMQNLLKTKKVQMAHNVNTGRDLDQVLQMTKDETTSAEELGRLRESLRPPPIVVPAAPVAPYTPVQVNLAPEVPSTLLSVDELQELLDRLMR